MIKKISTLVLILSLALNISYIYAEEIDDFIEYNGQYETIEQGKTYCTPYKKSLKDKLKSAFIGQPTGFTPQIQPSPYLNPSYGPSYMQGYYSGNTWNSHNIYNPLYGARLFGTSF